jgi:hypothetical protein
MSNNDSPSWISGSRPSTASRPMTASSSRPGTSSGRRYLNSSAVDYSSNQLITGKESKDIVNRELDSDSLLRIMNYNKNQMENEAILLCNKALDPKQSEAEKVKELLQNAQTMKALILNGLNVSECRGLNGYSILHHAAANGQNAIIDELLKSQRISVDSRNNMSETPLHLAVYYGHILTVDQLLDFGADINAVNNDNETCLFYAARKSYSAIIRLLVQRGIDINIRDRYDDLAIDHITNPLALLKAKKAFEKNFSFESSSSSGNDLLTYENILSVFSYLGINDILRSACVCSKWHRVSENPVIWSSRKVRRWELALNNTLGFNSRASSFIRLGGSEKALKKSSSGSSNNLTQSEKVRRTSGSGRNSFEGKDEK